MNLHYTVIGLSTAMLLSACGGGSSSTTVTGPVTSTLSFPLQSAYSASIKAGLTKNFVISGSCSGTASLTRAPATIGATFEGVLNRLSSVTTQTYNFTNCTPVSVASTSTSYFDLSYTPLGSAVLGGNYSVYLAPLNIPAAASVGGTGVLGTSTSYTSNTKTVSAGQTVLSYVIEPDTANTAIVNIISKVYNASNVLTSTGQERYQITAAGTLTLISADVQAANGSTTHLILQ